MFIRYGYIKNYYKLIPVDLSKQKELDVDPKAIQEIIRWTIKNLDDEVVANESMFILTI